MARSSSFLFGPVDDSNFLDRLLAEQISARRWAAFPAACPSYQDAASRLGSEPTAILLWPGYSSVPAWVWSAPVPVVALAQDANLLWHHYRLLLPLADLVMTDAPSAKQLRLAGLDHVRDANLYGLDRYFLADRDLAEGPRDIDVLFVGNLNPAVHGERLRWLGRIARLSNRYKVVIATKVFGAEYRALLQRTKVCFNRSIRGECNMRAFEAAASGAVLFQEADNSETPLYLEPHTEYVPYSEDDLEERLHFFLGDESERRRMTDLARTRIAGFDVLIEQALDVGGAGWEKVLERAERRRSDPPRLSLEARVWQRANLAFPDADAALADNLVKAGEHHAMALVAGSPALAAVHLARAAKTNRVSAIGWATALANLKRHDEAVDILRKTLGDLDAKPTLTDTECATCPYPPKFDYLRVGWDRAGWDHPDDPQTEGQKKLDLLICRGYSLLAELTDNLGAFRRAADAAPQLPTVRAALGCALARAGRFDEAAEQLRVAVEGDPFDRQAAQALIGVLTDSGQPEVAARVIEEQRLLTRALGRESTGTVPIAASTARPSAASSPQRPAGPRTVTLGREEFAHRFGNPDTSAALAGFTLAHDTHTILALVANLRPRRLLEIGTAAGHMTANLCTWSPTDAVVYSIGIVEGAQSGEAAQESEVPKRHDFARHTDQFGTAHKAMLITANSRDYDFTRLAPLDFAFIDGGHDFETVRSDTIAVYAALRLGGCMAWHDFGSKVAWVKVKEAIESLGFPEPVYRVAGTEVAYLFKGEGVGASPGSDLPKIAIAWDGEFGPAHSLAAVNRAVCGELVARGQSVALLKSPTRTPSGSEIAPPPELQSLLGRELRADATVRHRWPPDFTPPTGDGVFVLCQPWEFGRIPKAWIEPILETVDEVWAYSRSVERCYTASGIPADRVKIMPLGVDLDRFRPGVEPLPLVTTKRVKFLFVGGTIPRKGFDALLAAYRRAFIDADDVCLVVKEFGAGSFYRGQTAEVMIAAHRESSNAPEIEYLTNDLSETDLVRLYSSCDVLISAYRGEGFSLPVLEAMACGLPVVVTAGGPTDEFVPPSAGWRIPARVAYFADDRVGDLETAGRPWWLEPDVDALTEILRTVASNERERRTRGDAARRAAFGWTWARTAAVIEDRVRALRNKTPIRFTRRASASVQIPTRRSKAVPHAQLIVTSDSGLPFSAPFVVTSTGLTSVPAEPRGRPRVSLTMIVKNEEHNLAACLGPVRDLVDEIIIVDTGSTDRTREIALSFGAKVSEFPWVDSFSAGRNAALERATGDWAFWMDADDRINDDNAAKLAKLFASLTHENGAFVMDCVCVADSRGGTATAVNHVRLFRTDPRHRWTYRVHEQILPALRKTGADVRWSDVAIHHVGYVDAALRKRKLARDLRLLEIELQEQPNDPFTLFNLGSVYNELGDTPSAIKALEASLAGSHPNDSIVRKLYALIAQCHRRIGEAAKALATCRTGRSIYPDDAELLFIESNLLKESKDPRGAEELMLRLIRGRETEHFGSVDTGLRGYKARHNLACLYFETGRHAEAETQWRAALVDEPDFMPAHIGLAELHLRTRNWPGVERAAADLRRLGPVGEAEAEAIIGRSLTTRGEHTAARQVLESAVGRFPSSVPVWSAYAYALLEGGTDSVEAEAALRQVLKLAPENAQAKRNLEALYRNTGRWVEGIIDPPTT